MSEQFAKSENQVVNKSTIQQSNNPTIQQFSNLAIQSYFASNQTRFESFQLPL